jgi:hypothetical protein
LAGAQSAPTISRPHPEIRLGIGAEFAVVPLFYRGHPGPVMKHGFIVLEIQPARAIAVDALDLVGLPIHFEPE